MNDNYKSPLKISITGLLILLAMLVAILTFTGNLQKTSLVLKKAGEPNSLYCELTAGNCHLQLSENIGHAYEYHELAADIRKLNSDTTLYIHLSGNGGFVDGMRFLESTINQSGAHTIAVVEGDVYSAHAFLAVSFDELIVATDSSMLFHTGSGYREEQSDCLARIFRPYLVPVTDPSNGNIYVRETMEEYVARAMEFIAATVPTDRGLPAYSKCVSTRQALTAAIHAAIVGKIHRILTEEEMTRFNNGEDVVIDARLVLNRRLTNI